jgi:hypothetical protein
MQAVRKGTSWLALFVVVAAAGFVAWRATAADPDAPKAGGPRYSVVETEGTNLIVIDNGTNTLYYYTTDPDEKVGSDLKLRGTLDLNEVGKPVLKPKHAAKAEK